jgi:dienelactone hydrolase
MSHAADTPDDRNLSPWRWFRRNVRDAVEEQPGTPAGCLLDCVGDRDALKAWRGRARADYRRLIGKLPERVPLRLATTESVDCGTYQRDRVVFDVERHMAVPAYLLVPHTRTASGSRGPAILAQHGHGPGKAEICGLAEVGDEGSTPNLYAHELAERGYVVLAPDLRTFGERADWEPPNMYHCDHTYQYTSLLGYDLLSLSLWDLARSLDVLSEHPLVDPRRIGMVGLSQGGTCTLFMAAWDRRIKAAVVSGYFNEWPVTATIGWNMCGSQVIKGMLGRLDHLELGALIAPRPLLIETGTEDNINPVKSATAQADRLRRVYETEAAGDRLVHDVYEGGHKWHGELAYPFLDRWLGGRAR